jgi:uncharacterized protein
MTDVYTAAVERLSRIPGVLGALIVEKESAESVVAELREGVNGTAVAALAASLFRRTGQATDSAALGTLAAMQLEAEQGHVVVVDAADLILVVLAERHAQLGLVRLETMRAGQSLA